MTQNAFRWFEIAAVIATGFCKFIFVDLVAAKFWFILCTGIFWIGYAFFRWKGDRNVLQRWGLGGGGFRQSFRTLLPFALLCTALFIIVGISRNTLVLNRNILPALLLYPLWGIIQQLLIIGLIAGNMQDLKDRSIPGTVIILTAAIVFSVVHYPSGYLIAGTFVLALVYTPVYLRYRDVVAPGLYHGWLGVFFYYFVLGRDAWGEMIRTV